MKKFILKSCFFVVPFLGIYFANLILNHQDEGDLQRLGLLYANPTPKSEINAKHDSLVIKYTLFSDLKDEDSLNYDVLTIGDSFSEQGARGYVNYLAYENDLDVLHINRSVSGNQIQDLIGLTETDFFDRVQTKYVVLQSIERSFVSRFSYPKEDKDYSFNAFESGFDRFKKNKKMSKLLFSNYTLDVPYTNIAYRFNVKPKGSKSYKVPLLDTTLFSNNPDHLLFYQGDLKFLKYQNDTKAIDNANIVLNNLSIKLKERDIVLIVLVAPDKYSLYYPFITKSSTFTAPLFYDYYSTLPKKYGYINAMGILREEIKNQKDVYYYDDTHWSPVGAQVISKALSELIGK